MQYVHMYVCMYACTYACMCYGWKRQAIPSALRNDGVHHRRKASFSLPPRLVNLHSVGRLNDEHIGFERRRLCRHQVSVTWGNKQPPLDKHHLPSMIEKAIHADTDKQNCQHKDHTMMSVVGEKNDEKGEERVLLACPPVARSLQCKRCAHSQFPPRT